MEYLKKVFRKSSSTVARRIADELILVPIRRPEGETDSIYTLNEVAARIWELLDGERPVESIRDAIIEEFDVSPNEAEEDLINFLERVHSIGGLIEVSHDPSALSGE